MTEAWDKPVALLQTLFDGSLDIVGDVHGELQALMSLLQRLGYDAHGEHPRGRRLIFLGDLCDRGPDSPGAIQFVSRLVERQLAQCVLGNHELNLLRNERKSGNGWYFDRHADHDRPEFAAVRRATLRERDSLRIFASSLPLALQRPDLRITHAVWHEPSLNALAASPPASTLDNYQYFEQRTLAAIPSALAEAAAEERRGLGAALYDPKAKVPFLPHVAQQDQQYQMGNPLRVITSGMEASTQGRSFFANGKWRMVERVPWWRDYRAPVPVIVGHYWRWATPEGRARYARNTDDLFGSIAPQQWLDPAARVYCTDFSVGARYLETHDGFAPGTFTRLAAVRWPEREVVFDTGQRLQLAPS